MDISENGTKVEKVLRHERGQRKNLTRSCKLPTRPQPVTSGTGQLLDVLATGYRCVAG